MNISRRIATNPLACRLWIASCCCLLLLPTPRAQSAETTLVIEKPFLCIPLSRNEKIKESTVELIVDGKKIFRESMHLAEQETLAASNMWWSNLDVSQFQGQAATLTGLPESVIDHVQQSDTIVGHPNLFQEKNRPQIHFSFRHGVLGDPTAKFYYAPNDEWHLFYIYNPFRGKEVCWGHAVSKDLVHWTEKPCVFEYNSRNFNGVGFVDTKNHLGLNQGKHQAIVLLQTHVDRPGGTFSYMISVDGGETFNDVDHYREKLNRPDLPTNPLAEGWHDAPRIYWSDECQRYVLYLKRKHRVVHQYLSKDLKSWKQIEDVAAVPESFTFEGDPGEMVDMPLDGDPEKMHTVVMYGLHGYIVGHYQEAGMLNLAGEPIDKDDMILTAHFGYPTIWHNPKAGRLMMNQNLGNNGRGGIPNYEIDYRPDMSFPTELTLKSTADGPRLFFTPIEEIQTLYGKEHPFDVRTVNNEESTVEGLSGRTFRIQAKLTPGDAKQFGLIIGGSKVVYDVEFGMLGVDIDPAKKKTERKRRKLPLVDGSLLLDILVDTTSLEVYANNGATYIPHGQQKLYEKPEGDVKLFATGGSVTVDSLTVHELNSIWPYKPTNSIRETTNP